MLKVSHVANPIIKKKKKIIAYAKSPKNESLCIGRWKKLAVFSPGLRSKTNFRQT